MRLTSIPPGMAVVAVTALMLTACSSASSTVGSPSTQATAPASDAASGSDSTTPTTVAASDGTTGSDSTSPTPGTSAAAIAVCTTLQVSQVASLSGVALTTGNEQDSALGNDYTCDYYPASGTGGLSVTVTAAGGAQAYQNSLQTDTTAGAAENVVPLTSVGGKAFSAHDGVRALFGDRMIYVAGLASNPPAVAIIQALQAKLG